MLGTVKKGVEFRFFRWTLRVWKSGCEIGNHLGGRVYLFPWAPYQRQKWWEQFCWWLVGVLPKRVVYFAFVAVYGSDGNGPDENYVKRSEFYVKKHGLK